MPQQNTALQPFAFQGNVVRVQTDEKGNPWFCGKDVCSILGYTNHNKAINDHCKQDGVTNRYPIADSLGREQHPLFINEGNLYRLIIKSNKPEAAPFESWVCDEVLPTIRKTGSYRQPSVKPSAKPKAQQADLFAATSNASNVSIDKDRYIELLELENRTYKDNASIRNFSPWTAQDDALLAKKRAEGLGPTRIAKLLGRTSGSVKHRIRSQLETNPSR